MFVIGHNSNYFVLYYKKVKKMIFEKRASNFFILIKYIIEQFEINFIIRKRWHILIFCKDVKAQNFEYFQAENSRFCFRSYTLVLKNRLLAMKPWHFTCVFIVH